MALQAASNLYVINQPGGSQSTGGKHHQWRCLRHLAGSGRTVVAPQHNQSSSPLHLRFRWRFSSLRVTFAVFDRVADSIEFTVEARRFGALGGLR
jgi:hypothetical protein